MALETLSLQIVLLALILFSWGLLFLSLALPGQHAFRKDFGRLRLLERTALDQQESPKERLTEIYKKACSDCWSVLRGETALRRGQINDTADWSDTDTLYLITLKSALTSIRIRLRMARKVAGSMKRDVSEIIIQVEKLYGHLERVSGVRMGVTSPGDGGNWLKNTSNYTLVESIYSSKLDLYSSSKSTMNSHSVVPSSEITVIADGRDCDINLLLKSKADFYPNFVFHVAINLTTSLDVDFTSEKNIYIHEITKNVTSGAVHNMLMKNVKSPYTFIATELYYFQENINFQRLLQVLKRGDVWAVGGSVLLPHNEWQNDCLQTSFKNYRLKFFRKNIAWLNECLFCGSLEGPFLAATPLLKTLEWNEILSRKLTTVDLFLRAFHFHHFMAASCHDVTFPVLDHSRYLDRHSTIVLANLHRLKEIHFHHSQPVVLACEEMEYDACRESGEIVSPCCLRELASMIKFLLGTCEAHRLFCEPQEGSLLGAVKFGGVLPWERDADITFHTANFTALSELRPVFENAGYTLKLKDSRWCCVNGSEAGGEGMLLSDHWTAELYSQHAMDSEEMVQRKTAPTKIELDGSWVYAPENPGEFVRNRYGRNIFRHSEHWTDLGKLSGWEQYKTGQFGGCFLEGHHSCLDQNPTDGSVHFQLPCV